MSHDSFGNSVSKIIFTAINIEWDYNKTLWMVHKLAGFDVGH